ncbi:hypothetical protein [Ornithinimicrobium kibberense]
MTWSQGIVPSSAISARAALAASTSARSSAISTADCSLMMTIVPHG